MNMDRRRFLQASLAAAGAITLDACTKKADLVAPVLTSPSPASLTVGSPRPTLRLPSSGPGFPSPYAYGPGTYGLMLYVYDTLLIKGADGSFKPWLASQYTASPDGSTYTFTLHDGAKWHDGGPVTPQDVVFSFDYFKSKADNLPPTILFPPTFVKEVKATGPNTVEIRLEKPAVSFAETVAAAFPIVPQHIWAKVADPGAVVDPKMLVGSGPYKIDSIDPTQGRFQFSANDAFFLGKPFVKQLQVHQVDDELTALRAGDVDEGQPGPGSPTRQALRPFAGNSAYGIIKGRPDNFTSLGWNLGIPGPTSDLKFRQACAMAIDRNGLVERLLGNGQPGNPGFLPKDHPFYAEAEQYPFSPAKANQLLDEAGYKKGAGAIRTMPDGKPLAVSMLTFPDVAPAAEIIKDSLKKVGVQIDFDISDFFRAIGSGAFTKYHMALSAFAGLKGDPDFVRLVFSSRSPGAGGIFHSLGWKNAEFDDLADRQLVTHDLAERKKQLAQMQQLIAKDLPLLPLFYPTPYSVYRKKVFDQWSFDIEDKPTFVTGRNTGEFPIRAIKEA